MICSQGINISQSVYIWHTFTREQRIPKQQIAQTWSWDSNLLTCIKSQNMVATSTSSICLQFKDTLYTSFFKKHEISVARYRREQIKQLSKKLTNKNLVISE